MDRVDRWLNGQRGWRRLLIGWLYAAPLFLVAGLMWSGSGNFDSDKTVPTGTVLIHVVIAAVAGIPLAAVLVRLLTWQVKSRPWAPTFSWRMTAATYVSMAGLGVQAYGDTRTWAWQHQHLPYQALFLSPVAYAALFAWHGLYHRKLRRQAEAGLGPPRTDP